MDCSQCALGGFKLGFDTQVGPRLQDLLKYEQLLASRLELAQVVLGEKYRLKGECPQCGRDLTPREIVTGFSQDLDDPTTQCSGCHFRFTPILISQTQEGEKEWSFFGPTQVLDQLGQIRKPLPPAKMLEEYPALYRSALVHYGSLKAALKRILIAYPFQEIQEEWRDKVFQLLGDLPDTVIADCVGVSRAVVAHLRRSLDIPPFNPKTMLSPKEKQEV